MQAVAGDIKRELGPDYDNDNPATFSASTSLDESSLDAVPTTSSGETSNKMVAECMTGLIAAVASKRTFNSYF